MMERDLDIKRKRYLYELYVNYLCEQSPRPYGRALYMMKRATCTTKRALPIAKRGLHIAKTATCILKRALC